jgi:hypothetical protein
MAQAITLSQAATLSLYGVKKGQNIDFIRRSSLRICFCLIKKWQIRSRESWTHNNSGIEINCLVCRNAWSKSIWNSSCLDFKRGCRLAAPIFFTRAQSLEHHGI